MSYSASGLDTSVNFRRQESVVTPIYKQVAGEFPSPSFGNLRDIYLGDPDMYSAVNFIANRALSHGYHIECNPNVPGHEDAEEYLTDWLANIVWGDRRNERGYGPLLRIITRELGWGGSSLIELIDPDQTQRLAQVQLSSIWKFQRNDVGELTAIWQFPQINPRALTPSRYLLFGWNQVDHNPFSYGMTYPVSVAKPNMINGGVIPPMIAIKWQIEDDIRRSMHRYGNPHAIIGAKGIDEDSRKQVAQNMADPLADDSFITDVDVTVATDAPATRMNFTSQLDYMDGRIKSATGNVLAEMLTGKGFSYASAVKAGSLADEIVWDMQSVIQTDTEYGLLYPALEQSGEFDAVLMKPKFVFNPPDPFTEITMEGLNAAYQMGAITKADYVRNAKKLGKLDLDDPVETGPFGAPGMTAPGQLQMNPADQTNPLGIDPVAYQNMSQVQGEIARLKKRLEELAAGAASAVQPPAKKKRKA